MVLYAPNPLLKQGAVLVDTPGVEDLNQVRADVTYQYVPRADVIMFLMNCSQAGQLSEITFLRKIAQHNIRNVCFVVNMVDGRSEEEVQRVVGDLREKVREYVKDPHIFPVSAYYAMAAKEGQRNGSNIDAVRKKDPKLRTSMATDWRALYEESGLPALEGHLEEFITSESRSAQFVEHVLNRVHAVSRVHHQRLQLEETNLTRSSAELRERYQAIVADLAEKEALVGWVEDRFVEATSRSESLIEEAFSPSFEQKLQTRVQNIIESASPDQWGVQIQAEVEVAMRGQIDRTLNAANRLVLELSLEIEKRRQRFFADLDDHAGSELSADLGIGLDDVELIVGPVGGGYQSFGEHAVGSVVGGVVLGGIGGLITLASVAISGPVLPLVGVALGLLAGVGVVDKKKFQEEKVRSLALARQSVQELVVNARKGCVEQMAVSLQRMRHDQVDFIKNQYTAIRQQFEQSIAQSELEMTTRQEHRDSVARTVVRFSELERSIVAMLPSDESDGQGRASN